jgi:threonine/homoserine/homoserine lactone efflux protein
MAARPSEARGKRALTIRPDLFAALLLFALIASLTPGPNNLMLMTSGVKFGFTRTLPHLIGVVIGFSLMVVLVGFGLDAIFVRYPRLLPVMRIVGAIYMLWLAAKIAFAGPIGEVEGGGRPLGFLPAAAFQWVNPKAWVFALSALSTYGAVAGDFASSVALMATLFAATSLVCAGAWALFGSSLRRFLMSPRAMRPFNIAMALLLVASIAPMMFE